MVLVIDMLSREVEYPFGEPEEPYPEEVIQTGWNPEVPGLRLCPVHETQESPVSRTPPAVVLIGAGYPKADP